MKASILFRLGIGTLLAVHLVTAFAGVALLARMAPAIEGGPDAEDSAARLAGAGAWVMVLLGAAGLVLSVVVVQRLERRVLRPLAESVAVLRAAQGGDPLRRSGVLEAAPELRELSGGLDALLDERMRFRGGLETVRLARTRRALGFMLDRLETPVVAVDPDGRVLAASSRARELMQGDDQAWKEALRADEHPRVEGTEALPDGAGRLVRLVAS